MGPFDQALSIGFLKRLLKTIFKEAFCRAVESIPFEEAVGHTSSNRRFADAI